MRGMGVVKIVFGPGFEWEDEKFLFVNEVVMIFIQKKFC